MATVVPEPSVLSTRRGKFTLTLLCAVAFLDFVDASIVNLAPAGATKPPRALALITEGAADVRNSSRPFHQPPNGISRSRS